MWSREKGKSLLQSLSFLLSTLQSSTASACDAMSEGKDREEQILCLMMRMNQDERERERGKKGSHPCKCDDLFFLTKKYMDREEVYGSSNIFSLRITFFGWLFLCLDSLSSVLIPFFLVCSADSLRAVWFSCVHVDHHETGRVKWSERVILSRDQQQRQTEGERRKLREKRDIEGKQIVIWFWYFIFIYFSWTKVSPPLLFARPRLCFLPA